MYYNNNNNFENFKISIIDLPIFLRNNSQITKTNSMNFFNLNKILNIVWMSSVEYCKL